MIRNLLICALLVYKCFNCDFSFQALLALKVDNIITFLPTLLNQLLSVLLHGGPETVTNVTRVLVHIIDEVYEAGRDDILSSYVKVKF